MNKRPEPRTAYRREIFISVALLAATFATFAGLLKAGFTNYDDDRYVYGNSNVQQGLTAESLRWAFASIENANWHPLTWISLELDYELFGLNPAGYHGTNLLLHAGNGVLLFWALRLMTGAIARSALVAAFFAVHPLHVESVAWIAERKDVLSGFFWLLTLLAYWRYALLPSGRRYLWVASLLALGLMAKPMVVTLPCVLLLLDYWPLGRWRRSAALGGLQADEVVNGPRPSPASAASLALEKLPLLALSAASCIATILAQRHAGAVKSIADVPFAARAANACVAYAAYLRQTFWPEHLAVFYPHAGDSLPWPQAAAAAALLLAISLFVFRAARVQPYLPVGWCWYLGTLVPVIGLVQVGEQAMADRYMYLPMVGLLIAMVWCAQRVMLSWRWKSSAMFAAAALGLLACAAVSRRQTEYWLDSVRLWRHAVEVAAPNPVAFNSLGVALLERKQIEEGASWLRKALELDPQDERAHQNLGLALVQLGDVAGSAEQFRAALRVNPRNAIAHYNLGVLVEREDQTKAAADHYRASLAIDPNYWRAHLRLGRILFAEGAVKRAEAHFAEAVRINPGLIRTDLQRTRH